MKHNVNIPTELSEIKLDNLIKFSKVDQTDEQQLTIKALDLFCDVPYSVTRLLPIHFIDETLGKINKVLRQEAKDRLTFEMNGVRYGRIPNLNKISGGEYADLDTFITPLYEGEIKHEDAFRFLSTLYRPIKEETNDLYKIDEYDQKHIDKELWVEFKKYCPADVYVNSVGFFLNLNIDLQKATQSYLQVLEKSNPQHQSNLAKIGVGMGVSIAIQKARAEPLMNQARTMFSLCSLTCPTKQTVENWKPTNEEIKRTEDERGNI